MREWMKMILSTLMLFAVSLGIAQTVTVSGTVTDEFGPAPDVQVTAQQSGETTTTDENGFYEIEAAPDDTLEFLTIMGVSQSMAVNNQTTVNMNLREEIVLEDVVAIGYGTISRGDLTSSIASASAEDIIRQPATTPMQSLQGKLAGVNIINTDQPGSVPSVIIRGMGTAEGGRDPLYIVDGLIVSDIKNLSPRDIASIDVLKDASAGAIYGSRANAGVIIVTTKKYSEGDLRECEI